VMTVRPIAFAMRRISCISCANCFG
jgi:hypothetical protein